jgi:outer membrane protein insertion porin family
LTLLLLAWCWIPSEPFVEIEVRGNERVLTETILHYLGGVDSENLDAALQKLYATGLFEDIRFETEQTAAGRRLLVTVEEKPLLRSVRFAGELSRETELRSALDLDRWMNRPFGDAEARELALAANTLLGTDYHVEARVEEASPDQVDLELTVSRKKRPQIEGIRFVGNQQLSDEELRDVMQLETAGIFSWLTRRDRFDPGALDADLERLRRFLRSRGYAAARVGPADVEKRPDGRVGVRIQIDEGELYRMGLVVLEPGPLLEAETVRRWLPPQGGRFDGSALDQASERLAAHYRDRGYPTVRVDSSERLRAEDTLVDVALRVQPGPIYTVARITFEGNERHRDEELRIFLDLAEEERFNESELDAGVRALMGLGNFQNVTTDVDVASTPGRAYVTYRVVETKPFEVLAGGGLNGVQGASATGQLIARNLLGRAERMEIEGDLGNRFQNVAASYHEPSILSRRIFFDAGFRRADLAYPDETSEDTTELSLRAGGPWKAKWRLISGFRISDFTLASTLDGEIPFLTSFLGERFRTFRMTSAVGFDDRDRPFFTSRGLGADVAYEWVSGDVSLQRARARASLVVPIDQDRKHLLSISGQVEAIWPYGSTAESGIPRFERLFLGSENDLRGFPIRGVGPREGPVVVGGDRLAQASFEYIFELQSRLRFAGFFDTGNVYATDFEGVELPGLRYDAGGEARILAPIANVPVRIGYGLNLAGVEGEPRGRFFVSLRIRF